MKNQFKIYEFTVPNYGFCGYVYPRIKARTEKEARHLLSQFANTPDWKIYPCEVIQGGEKLAVKRSNLTYIAFKPLP